MCLHTWHVHQMPYTLYAQPRSPTAMTCPDTFCGHHSVARFTWDPLSPVHTEPMLWPSTTSTPRCTVQAVRSPGRDQGAAGALRRAILRGRGRSTGRQPSRVTTPTRSARAPGCQQLSNQHRSRHLQQQVPNEQPAGKLPALTPVVFAL